MSAKPKALRGGIGDGPQSEAGFLGLRSTDRATVGFYVFLGLTAVAGGSSRSDAPLQILAQLAAIVMIAFSAFHLSRAELTRYPAPLIFAAAAVSLVALQLVPVPPMLWLNLPGRAFYAQGAVLAQIEQPWRPISLFPEATWNALLFLLSPVAALLGYIAIGRKRVAEHVVLLILVALGSAIFGLLQIGGGLGSPLRYYGVTDVNTPDGIFANRNHEAILLCLSIPAAACWSRLSSSSSVNRQRGWISIGLVAFLVEMLLLCGSRSGLALGAVALVSAAGLLWSSGERRTSGRRSGLPWQSVAAFVALGTTIALTVLFSRAVSLDRLFTIDVASEKRIAVIKPGIAMVQQFFPVGTGFSTFDPVFRRFEPFAMLSPEYLNQAHNEPLQLAIEGGLVGIAMAAAYLIWWGIQTTALFRRPVSSPREDHLVGRLGVVVTGIVLLSCYGEYALRTPFFASLFVIASLWAVDGNGRCRGR